MPKPVCYLDLGGVVFYQCLDAAGKEVGAYQEIRPNTIRLLKTIHDLGYELRFLSGDSGMARALDSFLQCCFLEELPSWDLENRHIPSCVGNEFYENSAAKGHGKHRYVDPSREFIWIEDQPATEDVTWLHKNGWRSRFCKVNAFNHDEFAAVTIPWIKAHEVTPEAG